MNSHTLFGIGLSLVFLTLLVFWGPGVWFALTTKLSAYTGSTYAVYLDTGHIFYGKLHTFTKHTIVLTDVHSFSKTTVGETPTNSLEAQAANPLTRPENFLALNRDHVLFFEKVGPDAPILRAVGTQ